MPNFQTSVSHNLFEKTALERIKKLFEKIRRDLPDVVINIKEQWNGNVCELSFSTHNFNVFGKLTVKSPEIEFVGDIPWWSSLLFEDKIKAVIRFQAALVLDKEP